MLREVCFFFSPFCVCVLARAGIVVHFVLVSLDIRIMSYQMLGNPDGSMEL